MQKLPKECFECDSVTKDNHELFIVDSVVVFPDNVKSVGAAAFCYVQKYLNFVYGKFVI